MSIPTRKTMLHKLDWLDKLTAPEKRVSLARMTMEWAEDGELRPTLNKYLMGAGFYTEAHRSRNYYERVYNALLILNHIFDTYGVEYIASNQDDYQNTMGFDYLNTGDTYTPTILYDYKTESWSVSSWGDRVEGQPWRFGDRGGW